MNELSLLDNFFSNALEDTLPDFTFRGSFNTPRVDVKENKDTYTLEMDLPGKTEKDVNLELDHNVLTISSRSEENSEEKSSDKKNAQNDEGTWLIRERRESEFSRRFTLPDDVDGEGVTATFKNGVLSVSIPRKLQAAPKRIAIEAA
jgi:HSP20 family protein